VAKRANELDGTFESCRPELTPLPTPIPFISSRPISFVLLANVLRIASCLAFVVQGFVCELLLSNPVEAGNTNDVPLASTTGERALLNRVLAHWREREARIKSFDFAWDTFRQPSIRRDEKEPGGRAELSMDGDGRYRAVLTRPQRISSRGHSGAPHSVTHWQHQFDGATHRSFDDRTCVGRIWKEDVDKIELGPLSLGPLMLALRPVSHGGFDRSLTGWHIAGQNVVIENRHCLKLQWVDGDFVETLWVDPNRDDVIVGWARSMPSWSVIATIEYRHDRSAGWIPVRWTEIDESQRGQPRDESFVVASSVNQPIEPKSLSLPFPPGSVVLDKTRNERYVVAGNGSKAEVLTFDAPESLELHQRLEEPSEFALPRVPLKDGLRLFAGRFVLTARLDDEAVKKGLIDPNCEVELKATRARLKDFVRRILDQSPKPLAYELREGALVVMPAAGPK
jgi:hypothetical protein